MDHGKKLGTRPLDERDDGNICCPGPEQGKPLLHRTLHHPYKTSDVVLLASSTLYVEGVVENCKVVTKKTMITRLDNLARQICKIQADYTCQRCGLVGGGANIQWAHIEGRRKKGGLLRWSENNCLALCAGVGTNSCHYWFDNNKIASAEWLKQKFPDKY